MANDIYFGSRQPQEPVAPTPREAPPRAADRQPVTRDPHSGTGGAYSGRAPARDDGMMEQMRSMGVSGSRTNRPKAVRSSPPAAGGRTDRPAGTTAAPPAKNVSRDDLITERIDSELLHRAPTQILCNFIDTDDADAGLKPGKRISEKKKQKDKLTADFINAEGEFAEFDVINSTVIEETHDDEEEKQFHR